MTQYLRIIILLFIFAGYGCKKGEDDPAISFLSRKNRLEGNWKLETGKLTVTESDPLKGTQHESYYTFNETSYNLSFPGSSASFGGESELTLSITKKGKFHLVQKLDNDAVVISGTWDFEGRVGDNKNKERVTMTSEDFNGNSIEFMFLNKSETHFSYQIRELRNKKLVLTTTNELINIYYQGPLISITSEYTFVQ